MHGHDAYSMSSSSRSKPSQVIFLSDSKKPLKVLFAGDRISEAESELSMGGQYNQQSGGACYQVVTRRTSIVYEWL
ncbi:hypothetical protein C5167_042491 [Papaver somniferum]|uniref:Uncharacterized protein n=1 Tax=Papaver somniferum TaxID=3469 RepID=A0A4Y7L660_PAPSO|nr:hypothetical protein C5167_042491 [Papaver somniferum]